MLLDAMTRGSHPPRQSIEPADVGRRRGVTALIPRHTAQRTAVRTPRFCSSGPQPPGEQCVRHAKVEEPGDPADGRKPSAAESDQADGAGGDRPERSEMNLLHCAPRFPPWVPLMTRIPQASRFNRGARCHDGGDGVLGGSPGRGALRTEDVADPAPARCSSERCTPASAAAPSPSSSGVRCPPASMTACALRSRRGTSPDR